MDTYMHKTMASVASVEKIKIIRSQEFMLSEARQKFLTKMIILGPKTAILGPQFCRILVLGPHFWWSGGALDPPLEISTISNCVSEENLLMLCYILHAYRASPPTNFTCAPVR